MCRECSIKNFRPRCQLFIFIIFIFPFILLSSVFIIPECFFSIFLCNIYSNPRIYQLTVDSGDTMISSVLMGLKLECILESPWEFLNVLIFIVSHVNSPYNCVWCITWAIVSPVWCASGKGITQSNHEKTPGRSSWAAFVKCLACVLQRS